MSLSNAVRQATVPVTALVPGPESDIDPLGSPADRIVGFRPEDPGTALLRQLAERLGAQPVVVEHTTATSGGATYWSDARYRDLLLSYPRNVWSPDAVRLTVALVPGVRQVLVKDLYGGWTSTSPSSAASRSWSGSSPRSAASAIRTSSPSWWRLRKAPSGSSCTPRWRRP